MIRFHGLKPRSNRPPWASHSASAGIAVPAGVADGFWLKAENYDPSTGTWSDAGALGYSPGQSNAALRPTLTAATVFKGRPGVTFSDTQNLVGVSMPLANSRAKGTLMVAFRSESSSPPGGAVFTTTQDQLGILSDGRASLNSADLDSGSLSAGAKDGMLSLAGGQLMTLIYDGTQPTNATKLRLWRNLIEESLSYQAGGVANAALPSTTLAGGSGIFLGREAGGAGWAMTIMEVIFTPDAAISTQQRQDREGYLAAKFFLKSGYQMIVQGDSNAVGSPDNTANPWPKRVTAARGWLAESNNSAVGFLLSAAAGNPSTTLRDDWLAKQPFVLALGTNDLAVNHASLATMQANYNTLFGKTIGARFPTYVLTIPESASSITGADETTRFATNSWLMGRTNVKPIDIATALGSSLGGNFAPDNLHLSDAGQGVVMSTLLTQFAADGF